MSQFNLTARDLNHVWHPCSQMKDYASELPMIPIRSAKGVWLEDYEGKCYLDAISCWWVNIFGHGEPRIKAAIAKQLESLQHVILAGFSHEPAITLAERLAKITPGNLTRCFFAENGSSAVEIALKMSFQYWQNSNKPNKTKFINLSNAYHGETLGALAISDVGLYKDIFKPLLMDVITVESPDCYYRESGESWQSHSEKMLLKMKDALEQHSTDVAAVILEPLVQCAGSMRMYHPCYLTGLRQLCDQYEVHLIADEIAVGFGRTGSLFACEQANIAPDIMCLSKGITGGFLPLSTVLTHDGIYEAFYDDYQTLKGFLHSHSYTGNALACAAANATLDIFANEPVIENIGQLASQLKESLLCFAEHPNVGEVRQCGLIAAVEMVQDQQRTPYPWQQRRGLKVYRHAIDQGVLLRPLGNVIYFMPPYVITPAQIDQMVKVAYEGFCLAISD